MILRNGQPFNIDQAWTDENGFQYPANWYRLATQEEKDEKGFSWVDDPLPIDDRYYYDDGTPKPIEQIRPRIKGNLSAIRWGKQIAGIIHNDTVFETDETSKVNYLAALILAKDNPNYTVVWKAREKTEDTFGHAKFVTLTATDITTVVNAGIDYITKCFENEKALSEAIDAADFDSIQTIDLQSGWPSREY